MGKLLAYGSICPEMVVFLKAAIEGRINIMISGGTGAGKTTLLNNFSAFIPADERLVTIEDSAELQLRRKHVVRMETRLPTAEGHGEVTRATWCATPCGCDPTASSSAKSAAAKPSTCSKR